jgi:hypothetical protein
MNRPHGTSGRRCRNLLLIWDIMRTGLLGRQACRLDMAKAPVPIRPLGRSAARPLEVRTGRLPLPMTAVRRKVVVNQ